MQRIIQTLWFSCCNKARESDERQDLNFDMWSDHQSLIFSACYKDIKLNVWILSRISSLIPSSCSTLIVIICDAVDKRRFSFQKNQRFTEDLFQINHIWSRWFQRTNFKGLFQKSYLLLQVTTNVTSLIFVLSMSCEFLQSWTCFYWCRFHFETARGSSLWRKRTTRLLSECDFLSAASHADIYLEC